MNIQELAKKADDEADQLINMPGEYHPDWHDVRDSILASLVLEEAAKVCDGVYYQNIGPDHGEVRYGITACSVSIREKARALKGAKE